MKNRMIAAVREPIAGVSRNKSQICMGIKAIISAKKPKPPHFLYLGMIRAMPMANSSTAERIFAKDSETNGGIIAE